MTELPCPDCGESAAVISDVVTGTELVAALVGRAAKSGLVFEPEGSSGECLVYSLRCSACEEQSLHNTERLRFQEDSEPIG
jgi:hypothetical protein